MGHPHTSSFQNHPYGDLICYVYVWLNFNDLNIGVFFFSLFAVLK